MKDDLAQQELELHLLNQNNNNGSDSQDNLAQNTLLTDKLIELKDGPIQKQPIKAPPVKTFNMSIIQEMEKKGFSRDKYTLNRQSNWLWEGEMPENAETSHQIKALVITWNLKGGCPSGDLQDLVRTSTIKHNLIVVGTQECCRSIAKSFFYESKKRWEAKLADAMGMDYQLIESHSMNALHICVFAHQSIAKDIYRISVDQKASGFLGFMANKGCVSISLSIGNKSFLFMNCHLASGQTSITKRNQNYQRIIEGINLPLKYHNSSQKLFDRFDYIFLFGDLNYRINNSNKFQAIQQLSNQDILPMLRNDQLLHQQEYFAPFQEGLPEFMPTYKMKLAQRGYELTRTPGWTDRILFKEKFPESLKVMNYEAGLEIYGSDHRPVFIQCTCMVMVNGDHVYGQPVYEKRAQKCCGCL